MSQATPTQVFLILWDFSDFNEAGEYYEQVQAQLETVREDGTFQGHKLLLTYFGMEWGTWQTISGALAATDTLQLDFSNPISLLYYKNGDDYAAVIYDDNDNLMPNDESGSPDVSISTDNYEYY